MLISYFYFYFIYLLVLEHLGSKVLELGSKVFLQSLVLEHYIF